MRAINLSNLTPRGKLIFAETSRRFNDERKETAQKELVIRIDKMLADGIKDYESLERFLFLSLHLEDIHGEMVGVRIPKQAVCPGHVAPFDYLSDSFLYPGRWDKVCWSCRGGGKTFLGAVSTWLDSIMMAGCETKILGGSLEQSAKMYSYIVDFWGEANSYFFERYLTGEPSTRQTILKNKSSFHILTASSKSVRGPHVPRLKLDEIDEFDREIYEAACHIPFSKRGIKACTEIFSTMHRPYGLMSEIIDSAGDTGYKLYKWCIFEVLERCKQPQDACQRCFLAEDCLSDAFPNGKARISNGYMLIDDAIKAKKKVSADNWEAESLCKRAMRSGLVYRDYWDPDIHVIEGFTIPSEWLKYRALDFGVENPFVCMYIAESPNEEYFAYDEIYQSGRTSEDWAEIIRKKAIEERAEYEFTTSDPSGKDQRMTFCNHDVPVVPCWNNDIEYGIEQVKRLLKIHSVRKTPSLRVFSNCTNTIREFNTYHYPKKKTGDRNVDEKPVKAFDHAMDAIRYFAVDVERWSSDLIEGER